MTLYLRLYWEFFKTGLFAIGGGMATLPFLKDIGATTGWFSQTDLMNMLAVSESTPGPVGINMATYVGYTVGGVPGAIVATIGEVTPSIIVILIVAAMLAKFRDSRGATACAMPFCSLEMRITAEEICFRLVTSPSFTTAEPQSPTRKPPRTGRNPCRSVSMEA